MAAAGKPLVWLITGCSSGFGYSLALKVLHSGHKLIATSRKPSRNLKMVQQIEALGGIWLPLDINAPPAELQKVVDQGIAKFEHIDVLVNNAAIAILGALEDLSPQETHTVMETNFFGPLALIQTLLPHMRARKSGIIVNISSAAGVDPRPSMGVYAASKWALEGMSQGLAKEVAPFGIRVLIVQPGAFTTNIMYAATLSAKPLTAEYESTDVGKWVDMFREGIDGKRSFVAENDVDKGVQGMWEAITGTGRGEGKEGFIRMPLSADCANRTVEHIGRLQGGVDAFRDIWETTRHDGGVLKSFSGSN